ncbi:TPA: hypothetical protein DEB02_04810 [Candidatus Beckwithbacteria bacterium]|nr:MAG: hypothetical protein A2584_00700 [Candidatus Beckwithbacteria bacterium RIFOXYD1_FULL_50_11]HBU22235.1 hypothetical protein [Candidatus Beckwithbacteria bacterium]HCM44939.1 hypothetical protein [Candidatus Beckwithbacteria bacterium]
MEIKMALRIRDRILLGLAVGGEILDAIESGSRAYPTEKLYTFTPPGYSKRKYRHLVGRLAREDLIKRVVINGGVHFRIGDAGRNRLTSLRPALKLKNKPWDGFWRLVVFDVPERDRRKRDLLRRKLKLMGFGALMYSTYISPYDQEESLVEFFKLNKIPDVLLLEAKQKNLGEPKKLAEKAWNLSGIAKRYLAVAEQLTTRFGIGSVQKREDFLKKVYGEYLKVLTADPFLPRDLLPDSWPAEKVRKIVLAAGVVKE